MIKNREYIFSLIENKGNIKINQIKSYDQSILSSAKNFLDEFQYGFAEFYELNKKRLSSMPIQRYSEEQAEEVKKNIKCYGEHVFGWLPNGWILADKNVYFYFGNEHDFHASYAYMSNAEWTKVRKLFSSTCSFKSPKGLYIGVDCAQMEDYKLFFKELYDAKRDWENIVSEISSEVDELIIPEKKQESYSGHSRGAGNPMDIDDIVDHFRNIAHRLSGKPGLPQRPTLICRGPYTENSLVAKIEDDYIFERRGIEEIIVGRIDGDRIIGGRSWDGPVVANIVGNKLVMGTWRDGEVIACIDGDRIIEGPWRDGRVIGRVIDGDMRTSLAGAAYLLLL